MTSTRPVIDPLRILDGAETFWARTLSQVDAATLDGPSGCAGWTNRDLLNHVIGGGHRYAMLLTGASAEQTATTRGDDYAGDDPLAQFWRYEKLLRSAIDTVDLDQPVDHRAGPRPGSELVTMRIMELTLHAHDLCAGISLAWEPPEQVAEYLLTDGAPIIEGLRASGLFDAAGQPASGAAADRLLAFAGRS